MQLVVLQQSLMNAYSETWLPSLLHLGKADEFLNAICLVPQISSEWPLRIMRDLTAKAVVAFRSWDRIMKCNANTDDYV